MPFGDEEGRDLIAAIDRHGNRLIEYALAPGDDLKAATAALAQLLDELDPLD